MSDCDCFVQNRPCNHVGSRNFGWTLSRGGFVNWNPSAFVAIADDDPPTYASAGVVPAWNVSKIATWLPAGCWDDVTTSAPLTPARVADNPHKPGTPEHREWEYTNVHQPRAFSYSDETREAYRVADARLAALKERVALTPAQQATEAVLAEVREATAKPKAEPWLRGIIDRPIIDPQPWQWSSVVDPDAWASLTDSLTRFTASIQFTIDTVGFDRLASLFDDIAAAKSSPEPQRTIRGRPAGRIKHCHHGEPRGRCRTCSTPRKAPR